MARREAKGPYMIYNGPIPESVKARLAQAAAERAEANSHAAPQEEESSAPALILLMLGVLTVGMALGLWLRPTLDQVLGHAPPPLARAAIAVAPRVTPPAAAPPLDTSAIEVPASDRQGAAANALQIATAPAPSAAPPKPSTSAKAADKAGTKVAATADNSASCAPGGSKADQMVCADPALAAADRKLRQVAERAANAGGQADQVDWLVTREAAARRSPQALKDAYQRHIDEMVGLAEPPH